MNKWNGVLVGAIALLGWSLFAIPGTASADAAASPLFESPQLIQDAGQQLAAKQSSPSYAYQSTDETIDMSDGVQIASTVYQPQGNAPPGGWPAVIMIHGWGGNRTDYSTVAPVFAQHGFVVLTYDCRGFGQSTGQTGLAGTRDILDIFQLMTWLIDHAQVSPDSIGLTGISYGGGQSILAAADDSLPSFQDSPLFGTARNGLPPKVAAIAPIAGWTDLKYALFPNQVVKYSFDLGLYAIGDQPTKDNYPNTLTEWLLEGSLGLNEQDLASGLAARSVLSNAQWQSLARTPGYFFQAWRDDLFPCEQVIPLFTQAAEDPSSPLFNRTAAENDRLYLGGYGHAGAQFGAAEGAFVFQQDLAFMQQQLMHKNNTELASQPKVGMAPEVWSGENSVQYTDQYPPTGASFRTAYLGDGTLRDQPPAAGAPTLLTNSPTEGTGADPNFVPPVDADSYEQTLESNAPPIAAAQFELPVAAPLHLLGQSSVKLYLQSTLSSSEMTARLYDYNPNTETWALITRSATMADSLSATAPTLVQFDLFAANHVVPAGDQLVLDISPSDFPFFLYDKQPYTLIVDHDALHPSQITIPTRP